MTDFIGKRLESRPDAAIGVETGAHARAQRWPPIWPPRAPIINKSWGGTALAASLPVIAGRCLDAPAPAMIALLSL